MPPRKQPEVNPTVSTREEFKTLDQVIHPIFYDTKQSMFTILLEMPTRSVGKHQYHEGTNNTERRMIDNAKQSLAMIQELTSNPVELHYNTVKGRDRQLRFVIALSANSSLTKLKDVVKIFIHNLLQKRQFSDQIQVLVATGQKITWERERSHVHQHIIAPAVVAMMKKNKDSTLPEQYSNLSKREAGYVEMDYSDKISPQALYDRLVLVAYQSMSGGGEKHQRLETQAEKVNDKQAQITIDEFKKQFTTGTKKAKEKKVGAAMQFLISSAGFTIEQLQATKQLLDQNYKVKVVKPKKNQAQV